MAIVRLEELFFIFKKRVSFGGREEFRTRISRGTTDTFPRVDPPTYCIDGNSGVHGSMDTKSVPVSNHVWVYA